MPLPINFWGAIGPSAPLAQPPLLLSASRTLLALNAEGSTHFIAMLNKLMNSYILVQEQAMVRQKQNFED